jgi:hypothetical protein
MRSISTRTLVGLAATAILGGTSIAIPLAVSADGADSAHHTSVGGVDDRGHHRRTADEQAAVRHFRHHEAGDDHGRNGAGHHKHGEDHGRDAAGHHERGDDRGRDGAGHHERGDDHGRHGSRQG